jgi:hypothetical protein
MIKDTFKSFKTDDNCIFISGNACDLTVCFDDFARMVAEVQSKWALLWLRAVTLHDEEKQGNA